MLSGHGYNHEIHGQWILNRAHEIDASTPEQTDEARDAVKVGDHCWAISSGQLLIVLKVKDEYYEVCGDWECGMRPNELNILAVIPRPAGHETTKLYYLHDAAMSAEGKGYAA